MQDSGSKISLTKSQKWQLYSPKEGRLFYKGLQFSKLFPASCPWMKERLESVWELWKFMQYLSASIWAILPFL
jgi:hypothetical protein